jgi:hypothetical protein
MKKKKLLKEIERLKEKNSHLIKHNGELYQDIDTLINGQAIDKIDVTLRHQVIKSTHELLWFGESQIDEL